MHKSAGLLLALAVASLAFVATAAATHSNGTGPQNDLVAGTGTLVMFGAPMIHVNAHRNKDTADVRGHFFIKGATTIQGRVTCLNVAGNTAAVVGVVTKGDRPAGTPVKITLVDNGEPGTADMANFGFDNDCRPTTVLSPIQQGNFVIHQDPPLAILSGLDALLAEFETAAGEHDH